MNLFYRESGEGQPLIILHGLFGSSDNWYTLSKTFAQHFKVFTVDQRNHGQSPHTEEHTYQQLTEDLEEFIRERSIERPILLGHSMGGKTVMNYALKNPGLVEKLVVVDMMPKGYPVHHDQIVAGLESINLQTLSSRTEADRILSEKIPEPDVRQFLLKNLARNADQSFMWRINLPVLSKSIGAMVGELVYTGQFGGPALFVKGAKSNYYKAGDEKKVVELFPQAMMTTLDTGHWVQAEKPHEFAEVVLNFLGNN